MLGVMFTSISYSDGSANRYVFNADGDGAHFEYKPVRPEQSSTGTYSGGAPRSGRLAAAQLARLREMVTNLEADLSLRVTDRGKGTGWFSVVDAQGTRDFIIARGPALLAFDDFVRALS